MRETSHMPGGAGKNGNWRGRRWRTVAWSIAAIMLLLPYLAMQVTDQVAWTVFDFAIFAAMLVGVGVAFELAARMTHNKAYRAAVGVALAATFLLLWINGAVGIIGNAGNPANLMYGGVLAVAIIGAVIARFRPYGMARVMVATAFAQATVAVIALIGGLGPAGPKWPWDILILTGFFAALWLVSAWLFRESCEEVTPTS